MKLFPYACAWNWEKPTPTQTNLGEFLSWTFFKQKTAKVVGNEWALKSKQAFFSKKKQYPARAKSFLD
jgi:hypothetical protein